MAEKAQFGLCLLTSDGTSAVRTFTVLQAEEFRRAWEAAVMAEDTLAVHSMVPGPHGSWTLVRSMTVGG